MPNHLEHVVRPSQRPDIRPGTPSQIFEPLKVPTNEPITWGNGGDSVFDLQAQASSEVPEPKWESQRSYDVVRVYNPDDRDQFVDTEQMTEYQARNKMSKERFTMRFATNRNTENTEVISSGNIRKSDIDPGP
jgi:hypothetical protein